LFPLISHKRRSSQEGSEPEIFSFSLPPLKIGFKDLPEFKLYQIL